tara:strand:- start:6436 stop:7545 length:1110 start_codon:yes stop_codon:yes gene_type:complete
MKLIFLCGSLEPGRDGVGDYTRRLAGECIRQGHQAKIIALHDRYISREYSSISPQNIEVQSWEDQDDYGTLVPSLRWPSNQSWKRRGEALHQIIQTERPDAVSIQFVPYAFQRKGLPFGFVRMIRKVARLSQTRWHVMFHELWIGRRHSRFGWAIGPVQRNLCLALPKALSSPLVHTHMSGYLEMLTASGLSPQQLPLFGNIPVFKNVEISPPVPGLSKNARVILHFGTFSPPVARLHKRLKELRDEFTPTKTDCHFVSIGSAGPHRTAAKKVAVDLFGAEKVHFIGRNSSEQVSAWMQRATIGISRSHLQIYEKSGSTAAMLEHGLEVRLMPSDGLQKNNDQHPRFPPNILPSLKRTTQIFLRNIELQ